jgi:hypothetical protein
MSHKTSSHRNFAQEAPLKKPDVEPQERKPQAVLSKPSATSGNEDTAPGKRLLFLLAAIVLGLIVLVAKAAGLF